MKKLNLLLIFTCIIALSSAQVVFETGSWDDVQTKAKQTGKMVFLDCYTTWCGWCKWMDRNTFPDKEVGEFFNKYFINYRMDMEKEPGIQIGKALGIQGYPTFVFYNAEIQPVYIVAGAFEPADMIDLALKVVKLPGDKAFYKLKEQYDSGKITASIAGEYALALSRFFHKQTNEVFEQYWQLASDKEKLSEKGWEIISSVVYDFESPAYKFVKDHYNYYIKIASPEEVDKYLLTIEINYYEKQEDWDKYWEVAVQIFERFEDLTSEELNSIAWTCYEHIDDTLKLKHALEWAERSIMLDRNYYNLDTKAHLLYKLGRYKEALSTAEEAVAMAKKDNIGHDITEELIDKIREALD